MNKCFWRFLSLFIASALLFSTFSGINLTNVFADVQNIQVIPYPKEAGEKAAYRIQANINAPLNAGTDSISIILPSETSVLSKFSSANISVNPRKLNGADFELDYDTGKITLFSPLQKGDRVLATYRYDPGPEYTKLPRNVKYYDRTFADRRRNNGQLDPGEWAYEDRDNNNRISVGDRRLTVVRLNFAGTNFTYRAGSSVEANDRDLLFSLDLVAVPVPPETEGGSLSNYPLSNLKFVDKNDNGIYDEDDWLVDDRDSNGLINVGDRIIAGQFWYVGNSSVNEFDLDRYWLDDLNIEIGTLPAPLSGPIIRHHVENIAQNGRFDEGEYIYNKGGADLTRVEATDRRLTWVYAGGTIYPRGSLVVPNDKDIGTSLIPFDISPPTRTEVFYDILGFLSSNIPNHPRYFQSIYIQTGPLTPTINQGNLRVLPAKRSVYHPGSTIIAIDNDIDLNKNLFSFNTNEKFAGWNDDIVFPIPGGTPTYNLDDPIYRDNDNSGFVSIGDTRLSEFVMWIDGHRIIYTAGSTVREKEYDVGLQLHTFPANIMHAETGAFNNQYDPGELIYRDQDGDSRVSNLDIRYNYVGVQSANIVVPTNYPDAGMTLTKGWIEKTNEVAIDFANGGERQLQLDQRNIVKPVVPPENDSAYRYTPMTLQGGDMRGKGKFWYTVTALNSTGGESAPWEERVVDFVAGSPQNAVRIQWSPVENASRYRIYRTSGHGTFEEMSLIAEVSAPCTHYIDLGGEPLTGMPPAEYTSSFTILTRIRTNPLTRETTQKRLIEFQLSDYKVNLITGLIEFRQSLKVLDTIVADYDRAIKVVNESVVFQVVEGRGKLRFGNVLDPNIFGDEVYPLRLHRISASNPDVPVLLVRGVDYEFEDENNDKIKGLENGDIKFFIQLQSTDIVRAEYSHRRKVRGDMILVANGNEKTAQTTEGNIIADTNVVMKGRTLPTPPVVNVMTSEKGPMITFTTPVNVKPNPAYKVGVTPDSPRDLNITLSLQVGIRNPEKAGTYQIFMRTSKEQTEALSHPYEIMAGEKGQRLIKLTRDQQVEAGSSIALTTSVQDELGNTVPNINVVYNMIRSPEGMGRLDKNNFITDTNGKAVAMLTTSPQPGDNVVQAYIAGTNISVTFTITGLGASPIQRIVITPNAVTLAPRNTQQFRAQGFDANGDVVPNLNFIWSVEPPSMGNIDQNGFFTASEAIGSGTIYAEAYGLRGSASVAISTTPSDVIHTISIEPSSATVVLNQTKQFTAIARNQSNQVIPNVSFTWTVTPVDLGTVNANGLFTATRKGTGVVMASAEGKQAIAAVTVVDNIGRIEINPQNATAKLTETVQFYAVVYDTANMPITVPVTWAVNGGVGIITQTGLFTATQVGTGQVMATAGQITASATIVVRDAVSDMEGPMIDILFPQPNQQISDETISVRGTVKDPSGINWVQVNGMMANYDPINHTFASPPIAIKDGVNTITVTAEDKVGNRSTKELQVTKATPVVIKLKIGSSYAAVTKGGQVEFISLDVAPFIQSGRTLVPLRFVTEAFGSKVDWKPDPSGTGEGGIDISLTKSDGTKILVKMHTLVKTVIIERTPPGAFQPEVIRYEMEVAPFIVRPAGRTVVPIRFISEAFDAKVDWNATSQEITITFVP